MSLAIAMGISMMPVILWAIMEAKDEIKREKLKYKEPKK